MSFEFLKTVVKDKRESPIKPVLLKFGFALAISLGGILYTYLRTKEIKPPKLKPKQHSPGNGSRADRGEGGELMDDDCGLQESSLRKVSSQNSINGRSSSGDRDCFLSPEFNELIKEYTMAVITDDISPRKNGDSLVPDIELPKEHKSCDEHEEYEREIIRLQSKVKTLEERERNLEIQLLEYYGIKEQETAVLELQSRLRLNNMEAKIYNLKIESLLSDNRRLEAQLADYAKVVIELEAAKAKIKLLRKKLKSEAEQNREQILTLQDRVMKLQDQEQKVLEINQDFEMQLREKKELEEKLEEMKKSNQGLKLENSDLSQKLEYVQMLATSALDNEEVQELKKENRRLKQQNEDLTKEIERLQTNRSTDLKDLVYLRWTNACLRHELKTYQLAGGKTAGRELNNTMSPSSEEKHRQLVLEYAHKDGAGEKGLDNVDSDQCSSSQVSCITDCGERDDFPIDNPLSNKTKCDDSSIDNPSANKTSQSSKPKVFAKLKRLLKGKGSLRNKDPPKPPLERAVSVDNIAGIYASDLQACFPVGLEGGADDPMKMLTSSSRSSSRRSFDLPRSYSRSQRSITGESSNGSRRNSDDGSLNIFRRIDSLTADDEWSPSNPNLDVENAAKDEVLKCAEISKESRAESFRRRSTSFGSQ